MANFYIILLAALAPALILCWYIYRRDKYQHEPIKMLLLAFFLGVLSTEIAAPLEQMVAFLGLVNPSSTSWLGQIWHAFVGVAVIEEGAKLLVLWILLRRNKYFDEMIDGVVYAAMVGLGFAAAENVMYLFSNIDSWQSVAIGRAIFSVPAHFMFAVAMGYYYSRNHFLMVSASDRRRVFTVPVLLHGIFDALLMIANVSPAMQGVIFLCFIVVCVVMYRLSIKKINELIKDDELFRNLNI